MRRLVSSLLSFVLVFGMVPSMAIGETVAGLSTAASITTVATAAELVSALADPAVTEIAFSADIDTTAQISVNRPVTIDGAGYTMKVTADIRPLKSSAKAHALLLSGPSATPIVIRNLTVDSNMLAYGVNTYAAAVIELDNVTLKNSYGAGLTVNGSTVTATGLTTSGNTWGAVNADPGSGVMTPTVFTLVSGTLAEANKIWSDGKNVNSTATVQVDASAAGFVSIPTGVGTSVWTVPRTINVTNATDLIAAIRDLQAGDTINLAAGVYDVERQLGDLSFGGQTGWYLPIGRPGVTVKGAGSGQTTLTSSIQSANGAWASQDFVSIWANNVTLEGVTILPKRNTNKAIEVMGKNFTLRDVRILTNPLGPWAGYDYDEFAGSVYFNPVASVTGLAGDVGESRLENVFIESAWISAGASVVTSGTVALNNVTLDWVNAAYAPTAGYGVMSATPRIVAEANVLVIADDTFADFSGQVSSRLPVGATLQLVGFAQAIPNGVFSGLIRDGAFPEGSTLSLSSLDLAPSGTPLHTWTFPVGTLDPSFSTTFIPSVVKTVSLNAPLRNGRVLVKIDPAQRGAMPGPATLDLYVGQEYAGMKLVDAFLGAAALECTVDADGFITVEVEDSDTLYLIQYRQNAVTFNSNGGSAVASQLVFDGDFATMPATAPTKAGFTFDGWYADPALAQSWNFTTSAINADTTLYAKFAALPEFTVTFNSNGGSAVASQIVMTGSFATAPTAAPTKSGHTFVGWYADPALTQPWNFATGAVTADTTLYAGYKALPKPTVGTPVFPKTVSRSANTVVTGTLKPRHQVRTYPVRIYKYRRVAGKWKSYGFVKAKASNYNGYTKYTAKVRLPYAGRWRLRAYAPADSKHSAAWSKRFDYVTVR